MRWVGWGGEGSSLFPATTKQEMWVEGGEKHLSFFFRGDICLQHVSSNQCKKRQMTAGFLDRRMSLLWVVVDPKEQTFHLLLDYEASVAILSLSGRERADALGRKVLIPTGIHAKSLEERVSHDKNQYPAVVLVLKETLVYYLCVLNKAFIIRQKDQSSLLSYLALGPMLSES